jgi:macrolide transport system ATP-binding/permease protein
MSGLIQDLRCAMRQPQRSSGSESIAILIPTPAMCASVASLGFAEAVLIKPLPYPNPSRPVDVTKGVALIPRTTLA